MESIPSGTMPGQVLRETEALRRRRYAMMRSRSSARSRRITDSSLPTHSLYSLPASVLSAELQSRNSCPLVSFAQANAGVDAKHTDHTVDGAETAARDGIAGLPRQNNGAKLSYGGSLAVAAELTTHQDSVASGIAVDGLTPVPELNHNELENCTVPFSRERTLLGSGDVRRAASGSELEVVAPFPDFLNGISGVQGWRPEGISRVSDTLQPTLGLKETAPLPRFVNGVSGSRGVYLEGTGSVTVTAEPTFENSEEASTCMLRKARDFGSTSHRVHFREGRSAGRSHSRSETPAIAPVSDSNDLSVPRLLMCEEDVSEPRGEDQSSKLRANCIQARLLHAASDPPPPNLNSIARRRRQQVRYSLQHRLSFQTRWVFSRAPWVVARTIAPFDE